MPFTRLQIGSVPPNRFGLRKVVRHTGYVPSRHSEIGFVPLADSEAPLTLELAVNSHCSNRRLEAARTHACRYRVPAD